MRTTLNIPDQLLREARIRAAERHSSLTAFIAEAIRRSLADVAAARKPGSFRIPTFRGSGLREGVELDDTADLLDQMDGRR